VRCCLPPQVDLAWHPACTPPRTARLRGPSQREGCHDRQVHGAAADGGGGGAPLGDSAVPIVHCHEPLCKLRHVAVSPLLAHVAPHVQEIPDVMVVCSNACNCTVSLEQSSPCSCKTTPTCVAVRSQLTRRWRTDGVAAKLQTGGPHCLQHPRNDVADPPRRWVRRPTHLRPTRMVVLLAARACSKARNRDTLLNILNVLKSGSGSKGRCIVRNVLKYRGTCQNLTHRQTQRWP
jgi:hypothetical protein